MRSRKRALWFGLTLTGLALCASSPILAQGEVQPEAAPRDPSQWIVPLGDYAATRHSALKQINVNNVGKLKVAWTMSTGASGARVPIHP